MKQSKAQILFTLAEIEQLLDWEKGEFTGSKRLHNKLLRLRRKLKAEGQAKKD